MPIFLFGKVLQGDTQVLAQERLERLVYCLAFPFQAVYFCNTRLP